MAKKHEYKVGDKVKVRLNGGTIKVGTIIDIEYDEFKEDYVADLDCGNWCYLEQIIAKVQN